MGGRSPSGRATRASTEPRVAPGLGHSASVPNAVALDMRAVIAVLSSFTKRWWAEEVEEPSTVEVLAMERAVELLTPFAVHPSTAGRA